MGIKWRTSAMLLGVVAVAALLVGSAGGDGKSRAARKEPAKDQGQFIVHEWGTFLSVQGSDGVVLGGMVESEEDLPIFVRERSLGGRNRAGLLLKVETPVTYFYTDRPRTVKVRAAMPNGILTHFYPAVKTFGPPLGRHNKAKAKESFVDWDQVELIPAFAFRCRQPNLLPNLRPVPQDSTWRFVRDTDAAFVRVANAKKLGKPFEEYEKFLFYRGLGAFALPLEVRDAGPNRISSQALKLRNRSREPLRGIFAVKVEKDTIQFAALGELAADKSRDVLIDAGLGCLKADMSAKLSLKEGVPIVKDALVAALVQEGLYPKEARAMVNNWEKSYFRTEGLRLLYMIPRPVVDAALPIRISPSPSQLVRVMVGRVEVLTQEKERELEQAVVNLDAKNPKEQQAARATVARLGRFQEPALRRIAALSGDAKIRFRAEALIKKLAK
jgi:hypothetical protein